MNANLLRYEMAKKNMSVSELAKELGISRSAFWAKCNGQSEFKQSEIMHIISILELKNPSDIFFCDEVS